MTNPFTTSQRPRPGDHLVLVQFRNNPKFYQYLCSTHLDPGAHAYVYSPYTEKVEQVEVYQCFLPGSYARGKRIIEFLCGTPARNHEEARQLMASYKDALQGNAPEATVDTLGVCRQGDYVVSVTFPGSSKQYNYFATASTAGTSLPLKLYVLTPRGTVEMVKPQAIRCASTTDRFKRIIESNDGTHAKTCLETLEIMTNHNERNDIDKPTLNTTTVKEPSAMINITTITYINGRDVNDLSNDDIMGLIARANERIEQLEKTDPRPGRLNNEVKSLRDGVAQLVKLLDDLDAEKNAD